MSGAGVPLFWYDPSVCEYEASCPATVVPYEMRPDVQPAVMGPQPGSVICARRPCGARRLHPNFVAFAAPVVRQWLDGRLAAGNVLTIGSMADEIRAVWPALTLVESVALVAAADRLSRSRTPSRGPGKR